MSDTATADDQPAAIPTTPAEPPSSSGEATSSSGAPETPAKPSQPPPIPFSCHRCGMQMPCNYHGVTPPFAPAVRLPAPFYVKRNPFAPPPSAERPSAEYYLLLGADCTRCGRQVCRAPACSVFYAQTMCLDCAAQCLPEFPTEIRSKINRALSE